MDASGDSKKISKQQRLETKRLEEEKALKIRKAKALKGMRYLLGLSEKYSTFFREKLFNDSVKSKTCGEKNKLQPTLQDMKDAAKMKTKDDVEKQYADVTKYLKYFEGGSLRPYQLDGVKWMTVLFENGLNGILADEMGLGKTIQVIALICHLLERKILGPYLIVAPLSTLTNWKAEFEKFAPKVPVIMFYGSQQERRDLYKMINKRYQIGEMLTRPVVLTSYQGPLFETNFLNYFEWQYVIVDEGHRLKNHESKLSLILRTFTSSNRLLLTGTPLHNNITELWALLNFLLPQVFNNVDTFASLLMIEDIKDENKLLEQEEKNNLISTVHKVLAPFMLRRLKKDVLDDMVPKKEINVFCPLSQLQKDLYSYVITKNLEKLLRKDDEEDMNMDMPRKKRKCVMKQQNPEFENQPLVAERNLCQNVKKQIVPYITRLTMRNTVMMFKKIVDHPYLIHFPLDPMQKKQTLLVDENLVKASGKMMVLDAMLPELKKRGHKVLLFSTLVMMLDLIEEYLMLRGYSYSRLDGTHKLTKRQENIDAFNNDSNVFIFLISTRAGGLGLNLIAADTVIFFDRDWNPQVDIQAQDRCHRIGQTKPVVVYTLTMQNTIDEEIIARGHLKRILEKIVIKDGEFEINNSTERMEAESELKYLQKLLESEKYSSDGDIFLKQNLWKILDRSDLYQMMGEQETEKNNNKKQ